MPITANTTQSSLSFPSIVELAGAETACISDGDWAYTADTKTTWRLDRKATTGGVVTRNGNGRWLPFAQGSAVEVLTATDPAQTLPLLPYGVSILENLTGGAVFFALPDGTDGMTKTIVGGSNGTNAPNIMFVRSTNTVPPSPDVLDVNTGNSIQLVWITARGGWVATGFSANVNTAWD